MSTNGGINSGGINSSIAAAAIPAHTTTRPILSFKHTRALLGILQLLQRSPRLPPTLDFGATTYGEGTLAWNIFCGLRVPNYVMSDKRHATRPVI